MKDTGTDDQALEIKVDPISGEPVIEEKPSVHEITFGVFNTYASCYHPGIDYKVLSNMTWNDYYSSQYYNSDFSGVNGFACTLGWGYSRPISSMYYDQNCTQEVLVTDLIMAGTYYCDKGNGPI